MSEAKTSAAPIVGQQAPELQAFGTLTRRALGLADSVREASVSGLTQLLADAIALRDMYKKHHWHVAGPTFYALHQLFDRHADQQTEIVDALAERVQTLGGVAIATANDVAQMTRIESPARGREEVPVQLSRLLEAHAHVLIESRHLARQATEGGDDGTNDLLVSEVVRVNERQVWFISEHLVDTPLVRAR